MLSIDEYLLSKRMYCDKCTAEQRIHPHGRLTAYNYEFKCSVCGEKVREVNYISKDRR